MGEENKANYTSLIRQTIKTLNEKKSLTGTTKQQALRFYFWLEEYLPECDRETCNGFREYTDVLRKKGILQW